MKKIKSLLKSGICFAILILLSFPVTVSAAEDKNEVPAELPEHYENTTSLDTLQLGDKAVVGMLGEEKLWVEVVDDSESIYSTYGFGDSPVKTKTFLFTKENILGIETRLFSVTSTCRWIRYDKIVSFECKEKSLSSSVTCSWDWNTIENPTFCARTLKVTYSGLSTEDIIFSAGLDAENDTVYLNCSADFE